MAIDEKNPLLIADFNDFPIQSPNDFDDLPANHVSWWEAGGLIAEKTPINLAPKFSWGNTTLGRKNEKSSTASELYLMVHPNRQWITTEHYPYTDLTWSRPIPALYRYLWGAQKKDF